MRRVLIAVAVLLVLLVGAVVAVASSVSAEPWGGPVSTHFDGRQFRNLDSTSDKSLRDLLKWRLTGTKQPWAEWIDDPPGARPPDRVDDGTIHVTWINHASFLVQMDGINIVTDPVYSHRVGPFSFVGPQRHRGPGIAFEDLPPIDVVLVSHNHYDHMDVPTLRRLSRRGAAPPLVALGNARFLASRGLAARDVDWWQAVPVGPSIRVVATPARHWSARGISDTRRTLWASYVIEGPSGRVYFAGDTGYGSHFGLVRERLGPSDVALLPIGSFQPEWFMREVHLSPRDAVAASADLGAQVAVPMHFGTWQLGDDGDREPLEHLRVALESNEGQQGTWRVAAHGERLVIRARDRQSPRTPPDGVSRP